MEGIMGSIMPANPVKRANEKKSLSHNGEITSFYKLPLVNYIFIPKVIP